MVIETITYKDYIIKIVEQSDPEDPRSWDNLSQMICFHRDYNLGDKHDFKQSDY